MSSPDPYESESEFDVLLRSEMQRARGSPQGITPERVQAAFRDLLGSQYRSPTSVGVGTSDSNRLPDDDDQAAWDLLAQQALSDAITMPDDAFTDITVEEESSPRPAIGAATRPSPLPPTTQLQSTPRARSPPVPTTQLQGISPIPTTTTTRTRRRTPPVTTSTRTAPTATGTRTVTGTSTVPLRLPARRPRRPLFPPPGGPSGLPPPSPSPPRRPPPPPPPPPRRPAAPGAPGGGGDDDDDDDDDDDEPDDLQQRLEILLNDQRQMAAGRRIAGITTTNTVTTTYKDGRPPTVRRNSSRVSNPP